eukprot:scaffold310_cov335-Pavlova_lutheri.AAC.67
MGPRMLRLDFLCNMLMNATDQDSFAHLTFHTRILRPFLVRTTQKPIRSCLSPFGVGTLLSVLPDLETGGGRRRGGCEPHRRSRGSTHVEDFVGISRRSPRVDTVQTTKERGRGGGAATMHARNTRNWTVVLLAMAGWRMARGWQNYQGEWPCKPELKDDVYPKDLEELKQAVKQNRFVKGVGAGHSWDPYIGCGGSTSEAVNIVMTEFETGDRNVELNLEDMTVKVPASMMTRDLLRYLDEQKSDRYPNGLSLRSYPWWIDQTLCGAVATGTHGSSMHEDGGSLSSQVQCLGMVLADGEYRKFCDDTHPEEMQALKVSAGRLGVIAHCFMKVIPSVDVRVSREGLSESEIVEVVKNMQEVYGTGGEEELAEKYPDVQVFWFPQTNHGYKWTYELVNGGRQGSLARGLDTYNFSDPENVQLPELESDSLFDRGQGRSDGTANEISFRRDPVSYVDIKELAEENQARNRQPSNTGQRFPLVVTQSASWWARQIERLILRWYPVGTFAYKDAFLQNPRFGTEYTLYDQYEFSVPVSRAGSCFEGFASFVDENGLGEGFRTPVLVRLVKSENNILLSNTNGEPHVYINMNDDVSYNLEGNAVNNRFISAANYLRSSSCQGRLHWGKTKATLDRDTNGFSEYPETWCHFGRTVAEFDPMGKFEGDAGHGSPHNYWTWDNCGRGTFFGRDNSAQANCTDSSPPGSPYTCAEQLNWGKCERDWMLEGNFCASTCGRC